MEIAQERTRRVTRVITVEYGLPYADFFFGIFAPDFRASLRAIATACFRLLTFLPLPDFSVPLLCSFMTLWIFRCPLEPALELERE